MTTYTYSGFKVQYDAFGNPTTFLGGSDISLVYNANVPSIFVYLQSVPPVGNELPLATVDTDTSAETILDGISLNVTDFVNDEAGDEFRFGQIVWDNGGGIKTSVVISFFDAASLTSYFYTIGGDALPSIASLTDFNDFLNNDMISIGAAASPYGPTDDINPATSNLASSTTADLMQGTSGFDYFDGGSGSDTIYGNAGDDDLYGGLGADSIFGGDNDDLVRGDAGNDTLDGGNGIDELVYDNAMAAVVVSLTGGTATVGGTEIDTITGFENIRGSMFADSLTGDGGDNQFRGLGGNDTLDGGAGTGDWVLYDRDGVYSGLAGVTVDLGAGTATDGFGDTDTLIGIENARGSGAADTITGSGGANVIQGRAGNDVISAGGGSDTIEAGMGDDTIDGGAGSDLLSYANDIPATGISVTYVGATSGTASDGLGGTDSFTSIERIAGTDFADSMTGFAGAQTFLGLGGADLLVGEAGNDTLDGGDGDDTIVGGTGSDSLTGGLGVDLLSYRDATSRVVVDMLSGSVAGAYAAGDVFSGFEQLEGGSAGDQLLGDHGNNLIWGGAGDDELFGRFGNDTLEGGTGADTLDGSGNSNTAAYTGSAAAVTINFANGTVTGGDATGDVLVKITNLIGSDHADRLTGNFFANTIEGGAGADTLNGGSGIDTLSYASDTAGVTVDLMAGTASGGDAAGDVFSNFENLAGGSGADLLTGNGADNFIFGAAGDDSLTGGLGNDTLSGGIGADTLAGGGGADTASWAGSAAAVTVNLASGAAAGGDAAGDVLSGVENLIGSAQGDVLTGDAGANVIEGGLGADTLNGGAGIDTLSYAGSNTRVVVDLQTGTALLGHAQGDVFTGFENLRGSNLPDYLLGDAGDNVIEGGRGIDRLVGRDGADTLIGGAQNDNLTGGAGADVFVLGVGDGADIIVDWEDGLDRIDISAFGLATFADVLAHATDLPIGAVRLDLGGGNMIQINGFSTANLDATDVIF